MARPIKETPILYDEDSDRFLEEVKENELKKVSDAEYYRTLEIYEKVIKKAEI